MKRETPVACCLLLGPSSKSDSASRVFPRSIFTIASTTNPTLSTRAIVLRIISRNPDRTTVMSMGRHCLYGLDVFACNSIATAQLCFVLVLMLSHGEQQWKQAFAEETLFDYS